jgi:hypothetical protein
MRNIIPIMLVAATVLVGCHSPMQANKTTTVAAAPAGASATANKNTIGDVNAAVTVNPAATANSVVGTNAVVSNNSAPSTNALAATPVQAPATVGPNTPAQTLAENVRLGDLAAAFIIILTILALWRS